MKKQALLIICVFFLGNLSGQVLCVECYEQNNAVYTGGINLIQNEGFENGCPNAGYFCPNYTYYSCNLSNWTCSDGGTSTYAQCCISPYSYIPQGTKALYFGNGNAIGCSNAWNDTSCFNTSMCTLSGFPMYRPASLNPYHGGMLGVSLEQTVTGMVPNNVYVLEFWAGGEPGLSNSGLFAVDVGFGKTYLRDKPTPANATGTRYVVIFKANSTTDTIKFTNWGHICPTCTELVLDDVSLRVWNSPSSPCLSVGTNELTENSITLYPNPATEELTVNSEQLTIKEIKIRNMLGEVVFQTKINSQKSTIDIKNYEQGIYFVEVKNRGGVIRKKFIIVK